MRDNEIRNATIESTFLGIEDHGIFVWSIIMDYGGSQQGFQLILATRADAVSAVRIRELLETVGVDSWEKLPGKNVRCVLEGGLIRGVGHITRDKWFRSSATSSESME